MIRTFVAVTLSLLFLPVVSACSGELDVGANVVPEPTKARAFANAVALGGGHGCALLEDGTVACWGRNDAGQSSPPSASDGATPFFLDRPERIPGLSGIVQVTAGGSTSCALSETHEVICWGWLVAGATAGQTAKPVPLTRIYGLPDDVVEVRAGLATACARTASGSVWCWGQNATPQPSRVPLIRDEGIALAVSDSTSCVVLGADRSVTCWGRTDGVQPSLSRDSQPMVYGLGEIQQLALASSTGIGLLDDGSVKLWGGPSMLVTPVADPLSQNGNLSATPIPGLANVIAVAASGNTMCVLRGDGDVFCWGDDGACQFGSGSPGRAVKVPTKIAGISRAKGIVVGGMNGCALTGDDELVCWGAAPFGAIGDGVPRGEADLCAKPDKPVVLPARLLLAGNQPATGRE